MASEGSVTVWIGDLKAGDPAAAQRLWERYFRKMVDLARGRLHASRRGAHDEEDVALSAFYSFCRGAEGGRFQQLRDRNNLWPLLVVITARKAIDVRKHATRAKRGGGKVRGESAWLNAADGSDHDGGINLVIGDEPTPAFVVELAEEARRLLDALGSEELRRVAVWKMEGYSNEEIAARLGRSLATVERKLRLIRGTWEQEITP